MSGPVEGCEVCGFDVRIIAFKGTGTCCGRCAEERQSDIEHWQAIDKEMRDPDSPLSQQLREDWSADG